MTKNVDTNTWNDPIPALMPSTRVRKVRFQTRESEMITEDGVIDIEIQKIDNEITTLEIRRRVLLSQKSICLSCGEKRPLPEALNGICGRCESEDF